MKPDFCSSQDTGALSRDARLFFLQLLTECDDEGRTLWIPKRLCGVLYPHDDDVTPDMIQGWADECASRDMVVIYETDAGQVLAVRNWSKHQRISHPTDSRLAAPPKSSGKAPERLRNPPETFCPEREGKGKEQGMSGKPDPDDFDAWYKAYPRHEARDDAERAWAKRARAGELPSLADMLAAIEWQKRSGCLRPEFADGRSLIPLPATYLNKGRFKDAKPFSQSAVKTCYLCGLPATKPGPLCDPHYEHEKQFQARAA